jgi:uncharacterized protein YdaU (DUF1376 family)
MPVFTDALIGDTTHLSAEEFGCYCLLLFATWRNNGAPYADDDGDLARICRVSVRRWRQSMRTRLAGFFNLSAGTWRQKRLEKEWARCAKLAAISRSNGARAKRVESNKINRGKNPVGTPGTPPNQTHTQTQTQGVANRIHRSSKSKPEPEESVAARDKIKIGVNPKVRREAPPKSPGLRENIKEQLRQKLIRFCNARLRDDDRGLALMGLMGEDPHPHHDAQWWFDELDLRRKRSGWDDTREWKRRNLQAAE